MLEERGASSLAPAEDAPLRGNDREHTVAVAVGWTAVVVALRLWLAHGTTFCGTPDSCSYLALGESLSRHRGFVQNFLYQYQMVDVRLPQHGIEYWRPGTSFMFLLAQPFGGVTLHASLVVTILAGVLMAAAAWRIAWNATGSRNAAVLAYGLCLVLPPMWGSAITPDSSAFYGAAAAWFLALFRVDFKSYREDALAWVCLAALNLIRNDAVLLVIPMLVVLWMRLLGRTSAAQKGLRFALYLGAFGLALLPMTAISHAVLGRASAAHIIESIYLTDLTQLMYYKDPVTLHTALAFGVKRLVMLRLSVTAMILYRFIFLMCGLGAVLLPGLLLMDRGQWRKLRIALTGPTSFFVAVVAAYGLALPAIGQFSALRSFNGVLPAVAAAMALGLVALSRTVKAAEVLAISAATFLLISGFMGARREIDGMNEDGAQDRAVAEFLKQHGADPAAGSLVMAPNPAQFSVTTGYPTLPVPSNGFEATLAAAHDLHPTHVVLELDPVSTYAESMAQALRPVSADHVPGTRMLVLTMPHDAAAR